MKTGILLMMLSIGAYANAQSDTSFAITDSAHAISMNVTDTVPVKSPNPRVYRLYPAIDIPLTAVGCGWSLYAFTQIYSKDRLTLEEINNLDRNNVPRFDRSAIDNFDEDFTKVGDYIFYGSMPLPLLFLADRKMRKDFPKLTLLYLEAMGITGLFYTGSVYFADRYRPYAYNPEVPLDFRMQGGARNSFFAGHPALVGTSTFFMASTYDHYHPDSKIKWLFYGLAAVATGTTTMARYLGGRHFPSDLIIGTTLGPLSGILVPKLHRVKNGEERKTTIMPFFGQSNGLVMIKKF